MLSDSVQDLLVDVLKALLVESLSQRARHLPSVFVRRVGRQRRVPWRIMLQRRCRERLRCRLRASHTQELHLDASFPRLPDSTRLLE